MQTRIVLNIYKIYIKYGALNIFLLFFLWSYWTWIFLN